MPLTITPIRIEDRGGWVPVADPIRVEVERLPRSQEAFQLPWTGITGIDPGDLVWIETHHENVDHVLGAFYVSGAGCVTGEPVVYTLEFVGDNGNPSWSAGAMPKV